MQNEYTVYSRIKSRVSPLSAPFVSPLPASNPEFGRSKTLHIFRELKVPLIAKDDEGEGEKYLR